MRSTPLKALMPRSTLPLVLLVLSGCVSAPPIVSTPGACAQLLPDEWRKPVAGAPLPQGDTVGDWVAFGDSQTAQLDKANDHTLSAISIVERCEARDAAAVKRSRPKFLGIF